MEFIENINNLCRKADDPGLGYAQITIDFFQDFEDQFLSHDRRHELSANPIERDELGAKQYDINVLLDVIDPKFEKDIDLFRKMYDEIGKWAKAIEARNILLGIPRHKG